MSIRSAAQRPTRRSRNLPINAVLAAGIAQLNIGPNPDDSLTKEDESDVFNDFVDDDDLMLDFDTTDWEGVLGMYSPLQPPPPAPLPPPPPPATPLPPPPPPAPLPNEYFEPDNDYSELEDYFADPDPPPTQPPLLPPTQPPALEPALEPTVEDLQDRIKSLVKDLQPRLRSQARAVAPVPEYNPSKELAEYFRLAPVDIDVLVAILKFVPVKIDGKKPKGSRFYAKYKEEWAKVVAKVKDTEKNKEFKSLYGVNAPPVLELYKQITGHTEPKPKSSKSVANAGVEYVKNGYASFFKTERRGAAAKLKEMEEVWIREGAPDAVIDHLASLINKEIDPMYDDEMTALMGTEDGPEDAWPDHSKKNDDEEDGSGDSAFA